MVTLTPKPVPVDAGARGGPSRLFVILLGPAAPVLRRLVRPVGAVLTTYVEGILVWILVGSLSAGAGGRSGPCSRP
jgi:hypothetical protein